MIAKIDSTDVKIISLLMQDGRMSVAEITRTIKDGSERATHYRIQRLIDRGVIRIGTIVDHRAIGLSVRADIFIAVKPGSMQAVAQQLAKFEQVSYVACMLGNYDIVITVATHDNTELYKFLAEDITSVPGIKETKTVLVPIFFKDVHQWFQVDLDSEEINLTPFKKNLNREPPVDRFELERVDQAIVDLLLQDGRIPAAEIARQIGYISARSVRDRIEALVTHKVIHVCAIADPTSLGFPVVAEVILDVDTEHMLDYARELAQRDETSYVGFSLEKPNINIQVCARSNMDLFTFVRDVLRQMPGVTNTITSILPLKVKEIDQWRIPDSTFKVS